VTPAPIALFAYQRPDHLRRALDALAANPEAARSDLYVFSDAAREPAAEPGVAAVRALIAGIRHFARVVPVYRESNFGLAGSIIDGVGRVCAEHGRVIVLEDDLAVSPHFLRFMNDAIAVYRSDPAVASIHGYIYPVDAPLPETFFLRGADCWGWATWSDAWQVFEENGALLLERLEAQRLASAFDLDGAYGFTAMLRDQIAGRNDSWAIRWHAAAFLAGRFTLYPGRSLVQNIGNDGSGTHVDATTDFDVTLANAPIVVRRQAVREDAAARAVVARYLRRERATPLQRVRRRLRVWLGGKP
jgi:Glycosyl transferase family 2